VTTPTAEGSVEEAAPRPVRVARQAPTDLTITFVDEATVRRSSESLDEPDWLLADRLQALTLFEALPVESNRLYTTYVDLRTAKLADVVPYEAPAWAVEAGGDAGTAAGRRRRVHRDPRGPCRGARPRRRPAPAWCSRRSGGPPARPGVPSNLPRGRLAAPRRRQARCPRARLVEPGGRAPRAGRGPARAPDCHPLVGGPAGSCARHPDDRLARRGCRYLARGGAAALRPRGRLRGR
jgi:hypothetical protein